MSAILNTFSELFSLTTQPIWTEQAELNQAWQLIGWTMCLFLVTGTLVAISGALLRRMLRRVAPQIRYGLSLTVLATLAALPLGIGLFLYHSTSFQELLTESRSAAISSVATSPAAISPAERASSEIVPTERLPAEDLAAGPVITPVEITSATEPRKMLLAPAGLDSVANAPGSPLLNAVGPVVIDLKYDPITVDADLPMLPAGAPQPAALTPLVPIGTPAQETATAPPENGVLQAMLAAISYLPWLWILGAPVTFLLLTTGLIGSERLRKQSKRLVDGPLFDATERLRSSLNITRRVGIGVCERIASPLLIGVLRPMILLPPAALTGWTPEQLEMVLLHELAHVRRWDNLVNFFQRLVESLLFFHPAIWWVSRWVRADREECCDAVVVSRTEKPQAYAELLVALATPASISSSTLAGLAMAQHPLAGRIRRILKLEDEKMLVTRSTFAWFALATAALLAVTVWQPITTTIAQEPAVAEKLSDETTKDAKSTKKTEEPAAQEPATPSIEQGMPLGPNKKFILNVKTPQHEIDAYNQRMARKGTGFRVTKNANGSVTVITISDDNAEVPRTFTGRQITLLKNGHIIAEGMTSTVTTPPASFFPTLAEQRDADLAFKLLAVELEPLSPEELKRTKAAKFPGGLRVVNTESSQKGITSTRSLPLPGDILVGLHVWPTTSLADVRKILEREDIRELTPLKFYVLRKHPAGGGGFGGGGTYGRGKMSRNGTDNIITGRIAVDIDAMPIPGHVILSPSPVPPQAVKPNNKPILLYKGKDFNHWRTQWKTELQTKQRTESIKALAAFGRAGYGKEAAETILEVAGEYEFSPTNIPDAGDVSVLRQSILNALTVEYKGRLAGEDWLPNLLQRYEKNPTQWEGLLRTVLFRMTLYNQDQTTYREVIKLVQNKDNWLREASIDALSRCDKYEQELLSILEKFIASEKPADIVLGVHLLTKTSSRIPFSALENSIRSLPALFTALQHPHPEVQWEARKLLSQRNLRKEDRQKIQAFLLAESKTIEAEEKLLATIRAFGALAHTSSSERNEKLATYEMLMKKAKSIDVKIALLIAARSLFPEEQPFDVQSSISELVVADLETNNPALAEKVRNKAELSTSEAKIVKAVLEKIALKLKAEAELTGLKLQTPNSNPSPSPGMGGGGGGIGGGSGGGMF